MVSLAGVGLLLWVAFAVELGDKTFAQHIDTISETPEAHQLIAGARAKINPALRDMRDRVLGEYVEAPTWIPADGGSPPVGSGGRASDVIPASAVVPALEERGLEPALPGSKRARASSLHRGLGGDTPDRVAISTPSSGSLGSAELPASKYLPAKSLARMRAARDPEQTARRDPETRLEDREAGPSESVYTSDPADLGPALPGRH